MDFALKKEITFDHANWFSLIVLGFLLMSGGASEDPQNFLC